MYLPTLRCRNQERFAGFPTQRVWGSTITPLNERGAHTWVTKSKSDSLQSLSTLSSQLSCPYKESRNIHCVHHWWKRVGQPRLLERGISSTPYTVRPIGLHSLATIRFQKKIKWLYWQTSYYNWGYCRIGLTVSTPFLWALFVTNCYN